MTDPLCEAHEAEIFKGLVHLALFGLAVTCANYNTMAFVQRRERHLAVNVGVYWALVWWEGKQISRHLDGSRGRD